MTIPTAHPEPPPTRLNAVCPYFTMFPLSFPLAALASAPPEARVLDPFCGRGTTLFAARMLGLDVTGVDINPVAVAIAEAKLASARPASVVRLARRLMEEHRDAAELPEGEFWSLAFDRDTLRDIVALRAGLISAPATDTVKLLRAIVLGALHGPRGKIARSYFSNQMPRTYATKPASAVKFWLTRHLMPEPVDVGSIIDVRARRFLEELPPRAAGCVRLGDARHALPRRRDGYTHIVCSPPYLGMRTYSPDQWLRGWFIGGPSDVDYQMPGQIASTNRERFVADLADTWDAVAEVCSPGAGLTVRFGALPSLKVEPHEVIATSLRQATRSWSVLDVRGAGKPRKGRRQAAQFGNATTDAEHEIDIIARLA